MLKKIIGLLLLSTVMTQSIANIHFKNFRQEDGLPDSKIWAITQDNDGFIWIGTGNGLAKYDGYNFTSYNLTDTNVLALPTNHVKSLYVEESSGLWIGTIGSGLINYNEGKFSTYQLPINNPPKDILTIFGTKDYIWLGTESGLYTIHLPSKNVSHIKAEDSGKSLKPNSNRVNSIISNSNEVLAAYEYRILAFNQNNSFVNTLPIKFPDKALRVRKLIKESEDSLLIATNENLYRYNLETKNLTTISDSLLNTSILDALVTEKQILVATFDKGLYSFENEQYFYRNSKYDDESLPHNLIISLFRSREGVIWIGTFDGLAKVNPTIDNFKLISHKTGHLDCFNSNNIISVNSLTNGSLLISTADQAVIYQAQHKICNQITPPKESINSLYQFTVYDSLQEDHDNIWLASSFGLLKVDNKGSLLESLPLSKTRPRAYTVDHYGEKAVIVGTTEGAFIVNKETGEVKALHQIRQGFGQSINSVKTKDKTVYIGAQNGLYKYNGDTITEITLQPQVPIGRVNDILLSDNSFFVASNRGVIYEISYQHNTLISESYIDAPNHAKSIQSIELSGKRKMWASTKDGLYKLDIDSGEIYRYTYESGLQSNTFNIRAATKNSNDLLYFAGNQGITFFRPNEISSSPEEPRVAATRINVFANKELSSPQSNIDPSSNGIIPDSLTLSHTENDFSIEFAGLHYSSPENIEYAYLLEGVHSDWIPTSASNRTTTFSNLSPGKYVFRVKAKSDHSNWSSKRNSLYLPITIHPPIWMTWWAKLLYVVSFILLVLLYINLRTRKAVREAKKLQMEVKERTHQIANQKSVIENLLEKKNELFANISHEFRTPLALILGPTQKELDSLDTPKSEKNLSMIQRNANRLLAMVEQILKLAELKKENPVSNSVVDVNQHLLEIIEMFKSLAHKKKISLSSQLDQPSKVLIAGDSFEVMIGNLLSNAIKYTQAEGFVRIETKIKESDVIISITDNGFGIDSNQQNEIFERFVRLENTSDISGTGIGLSIVKQLVIAHGGDVKVNSTLGQGSSFHLRLPQTDFPIGREKSLLSSSISYLTSDHFLPDNKSSESQSVDNSDDKESLLIIDDNSDMRDYLELILGTHYKCYSSPRGQQGVELAVDIIPDLVLCDIMMPGIDGYEVAYQLRSDSRTSHIPIILLTAKGDKQSRIKGWDNDIDAYMTKPFDEHELLLRVKNILSVRNILKDKISSKIGSGFLKHQSGLNQRDQMFVNKLYDTFEKFYQDPTVTRVEIANFMAVSDRQLQRKIKGLVNKNPMDLFRDYRLDKAKQLLSTGKQISLISDLCGFSSASYFSQCFKAKFGISPKEFQK